MDVNKQEEIKQVKEWICKLEERLAILEADFDHTKDEWQPPYSSPVKPKLNVNPAKPKTIWTAGGPHTKDWKQDRP